MKLSDFDYHLPDELIAQYPPEHRAGGRLLDVSALGAVAGLAIGALAGLVSSARWCDRINAVISDGEAN